MVGGNGHAKVYIHTIQTIDDAKALVSHRIRHDSDTLCWRRRRQKPKLVSRVACERTWWTRNCHAKRCVRFLWVCDHGGGSRHVMLQLGELHGNAGIGSACLCFRLEPAKGIKRQYCHSSSFNMKH